MEPESYGTITNDDVDRIRERADAEMKEMTPAKARGLLTEIGALTPDGQPTWPQHTTQE